MTRFNCLTSDAEIETFSAFYVAPVRDDRSSAEIDSLPAPTEIVQCEPGEAEFYTIYGSAISESGCQWMAVHDAHEPQEIVRIAKQINLETGKPFFYRDERYGCVPSFGADLDFTRIAEALTEEIHDELPDLDASDFGRVDDFDNHTLAPMREAFVEFSDYSGLNTARDPYKPSQAA
ncbi:hypothetical protein [Roseovarius sp. MMSF_3281]|uniref:hypothetical protein n=1 Tax=Roseovarius sp. MMSF_3281 TaxID=3046694 RepID=UPI00273E8E97|nr:hypothetical protein [Roseovarius sp. MMSF_3281]